MTTRLDAPAFARAWLAVRQATAVKDDAAVLSKTVAIEEYTRGLRLVSTDRYMLLTAWVPSLDASRFEEPTLDEAPDRTIIAADLDGRGKSLLGYVLQLARRMETDNLPAGAIEIRLDFDVKIPAGDDVPETFEGLEPVFTTLSVPDVEKVYLPVVQAEYPEWRAVRAGFTGVSTAALALSPELVIRTAGVAKWAMGPLVVTFGGPDKVMAVDYPESEPHVTGFLMPSRLLLDGEPDPDAEDEADDGQSFRDAIHDAAAANLPEGVTVTTSDGRTSEGLGASLRAGESVTITGPTETIGEDSDDWEDGDRLYCPTCPRIVDVDPEDADASLSYLVNHVRSHGFSTDDALAAIHADTRNVEQAGTR